MNSGNYPGQKAGLPPGTAMYIGNQSFTETGIRHISYNHETITDCSRDTLSMADISSDTNHLVFISGLHNTQRIEEIGNNFGISGLVIEDVLNTLHMPKLEDHDNCLFVIIKDLVFDPKKNKPVLVQYSFVFFERLLLCFSEQPASVFEPVISRLNQSSAKLRSRGSDYLFYELLDVIIDRYIVAAENLHKLTSDLEDKVYQHPGNDFLQKLQINRKSINFCTRSVSPVGDMLFKIRKTGQNLIPESGFRYIDDLLDHVRHSMQLFESLREMNAGLREAYATVVNLKMNRIMKVLTLVSTIFIPLSFFAGVYGMNFDHIPELHVPYGYLYFWIAMLLIVALLLFMFRRKKWL